MLQGQANAKMISNIIIFKIEVFYMSILWLTPEEKVGALNMDCSIKTNQNFFPVLQEEIDISGSTCCRSHSNNEEMAVNKICVVFPTKAYFLLHLCFLCGLGWKACGFRNVPEAYNKVQRYVQSFSSGGRKLSESQILLTTPSLFCMKAFAVINKKNHADTCGRWEECSHHAQLARYFLQSFSLFANWCAGNPFHVSGWHVCTWGQPDDCKEIWEEPSLASHTFLFWGCDLRV